MSLLRLDLSSIWSPCLCQGWALTLQRRIFLLSRSLALCYLPKSRVSISISHRFQYVPLDLHLISYNNSVPRNSLKVDQAVSANGSLKNCECKYFLTDIWILLLRLDAPRMHHNSPFVIYTNECAHFMHY